MIVALLFIALLQDGPVRTAPTVDPATLEGPVGPVDPTAHCTFGGRPVSGPGCPPVVRRRLVTGAPAPAAGQGEDSSNAPTTDGGVPAWAIDDPSGWEAGQCGAAGDDACRRQARNRLAMARAGVAAEAPVAGSGGRAPDNCRMVMQRSETGFGGRLSRVCGDAAETGAALDRLAPVTRPAAPEPCDRPASLESQAAWIARCSALPTP